MLQIPRDAVFSAVRSSEDVYNNGQVIVRYNIEIEVEGEWKNMTVRGGSVGIGVIDIFASPLRNATRIKFICLLASGPTATISSIDLYLPTPPSD